MTTSSNEPDAALRITVTPSQSSYFAGEPFAVTITFTNTHSPEAPVQPRSASNTHKRGAHSISSAPISRPPTSPGIRTPNPFVPKRTRRGDAPPSRKGLIGHSIGPRGSDTLPDLIEQRRKRLLAKSLSVAIAPHELEDELADIPRSASFLQRGFDDGPYISPTSPNVSSPLSRSDTLPLAANHPHARKDSLLDGQLSLREMTSPTSVSSPYTSTSSTSTFSLVLDPIIESTGTPYPPAPSVSSPRVETPSSHLPSNAVHAYPSTYRPSRRPAQIGLGQPPPDTRLRIPPRTAFSSTFPQTNTELILYSYVQLTGSLMITTTPTSLEQTQTLNSLRSSLLRRPVVGGGSMDITSSQNLRPRNRRTHSRSSSISSGIMSLLSPSPSTPHFPSTPGPSSGSLHIRTPSTSSPLSPSSSWMGFGPIEDIDPDTPLPIIEIQPVMLAVDLSLLPGESRTYTYTVSLPSNLPPTFRGRSFKFSYELTVGTCRAGSTSSNSISRVMKVPIRMYNNVQVGRVPRPYDLLWPVKTRMDISGSVVEDTQLQKKAKAGTGSLEEVKSYARHLLLSIPDTNINGAKIKMSPETVGEGREWRRHYSHSEEGSGGLTGCREAVEILTRIPKKASYDVTKDSVKVAVLTFTKSAYRLGETIQGVVELNERTSRSRVLQMSAMLETQEHLPSSIASPSNSRHLRRVHAEYHSSFTLSTLRTTFSLDIPSDGSPAFQISIGDDFPTTLGGLEWKVRLCLLVSIAAESSHAGSEGVRMKSLVRDGPEGEWGASWWATKSIAPMEKPVVPVRPPQPQGWAAYLAASILGTGESEYHDGDEEEVEVIDGIKADPGGGVGVGVDFGGGREGWKAVKVETVECEVPVKVWPGNTAFKALDVVFTV
ncbi:Rgp1-domain-containing protein [Armillaria borealis]|uniref:Rgp1-domain-containing protein n=1 Tax=Armillaria borealis TaxID=47425 RepID=A0AA39MID6_9AGAR|nr:Rgp1-domain-containing protein [Armillaria borealis]